MIFWKSELWLYQNKASVYADDLVIFCKNLQQLENAVKVLKA